MPRFKISKFLNELRNAQESTAVTVNGSVVPDDLLGRALLGDDGDNRLIGSGEKTVFYGAGGNDTFIGKFKTVNTAVYAFTADKYQVTTTRDGFSVKALLGNEGTDTLKNVSQIMFAGQLYTIEATGRGQPAKLTKVVPPEETPIPTPDPTEPTGPTETGTLTITSGSKAQNLKENSSPNSLVYSTTAEESGTTTVTTARIATFAATTATTIAYSLKAGVGDAAAFDIDPASGAVTLKGSPNYEAKSSYTFTVVATDTNGNSAEQSVTMAVDNVDEVAPTITSAATASVNENNGTNKVVYTATSTDSDYVSGSTVYSLKAGVGDASAFTIDPATGAVTMIGNPNFEAKSSYTFTVLAKDAAGNTSEKPVTLSVKNLDEVAPTITSSATATAINENVGAGKVVYTVTSTDTGDIATGSTIYSLKSGVGDASAFTINPTTGAVTLTGNPDFEAKASYNFTVVATDAAGNAAEKGVSLSINDVAETAPSSPTSPTSPSSPSSPSTPSTPSAPGDVVGFSLQNTGTAEGTGYITFGQVFAAGAVNPGTPMIAKIGGVDVPVQMDVKTLNDDGSVAHAILTLKAPALSAGASVSGVLAKASSGSSATAITAQDVISKGLDLKVEFNIGGTVKTIDAATVLQQAIANGTVETWLKGAQASEFRVTANVTTNLDITFDIRLDAAGKFHTDVIVARDDAYSTSTSTLNYGVKIIQDGQTKFSDSSISHHAYSNWHEVVTSNGSISPQVVYDMQYLIDTGALPTYDLSTEISASAIDETLSQLNGSDTGPMGSALVNTYMPSTGGRADIGPETMWAATYVTSQDSDAYKVMMANADASGSAPWHVIDSNGDPVRIDLHPNLWLDWRGTVDRYGSDSLPNGFDTSGSGWTLDTAHAPSLAYVPYLVSGSRYYVDEVAAQAAYAIAAFDPNYRDFEQGIIPGNVAQVRDYAWTLRSVSNAAYVLPEGDPMKAYFEKILDNNLQKLIDTYVNGPQGDAQGQLEGWIWGEYRTENAIPPWQQDYIATALGEMSQHGFEKADILLGWMDNFLSGRFINEHNGFNPLNGPSYDLIVINPATGQPYQTWAEAYQATFGNSTPSQMIESGYPDWAGGYAANAKASLAAVISATQSGTSIEAYGFLQSQTTAMLSSYQKDPTWNMAPELAEGKYLTNDEIKVHTGTGGTTMTAADGVEQMLIGNVGNDTIVGGSGINMLFGMDGNDTITAGSGKTYLYGGDGNDRLIDGAGGNYLKGGVGSDVFSFTIAGSADDIIADFAKGTDRIEIKSNLNGSGITTAAQVVASATAGADGAVLHFGSHDIVLQGVMLNQLTPDIFTIV